MTKDKQTYFKTKRCNNLYSHSLVCGTNKGHYIASVNHLDKVDLGYFHGELEIHVLAFDKEFGFEMKSYGASFENGKLATYSPDITTPGHSRKYLEDNKLLKKTIKGLKQEFLPIFQQNKKNKPYKLAFAELFK